MQVGFKVIVTKLECWYIGKLSSALPAYRIMC